MSSSDEEYIRALRAASEAEQRPALVELRAILRAALGRSFGRQLGDSDLDDLAQESMLRIHTRLDSFEHNCRFTTWARSPDASARARAPSTSYCTTPGAG